MNILTTVANFVFGLICFLFCLWMVIGQLGFVCMILFYAFGWAVAACQFIWEHL
jgi:hypothetical protein